MDEAEAYLWEAVEPYNLAKDDSTSLIKSGKFLLCLNILLGLLES